MEKVKLQWFLFIILLFCRHFMFLKTFSIVVIENVLLFTFFTFSEKRFEKEVQTFFDRTP